MGKFKKLLLLIFILTVFSSCGFKAVNYSELLNFTISEIKTSGEKRINYKIKNKLKASSNSKERKLISLNLNTTKVKSVKEKNIKNEITKYEIAVTVNVKVLEINSNNKIEFTKKINGDYSVSNKYSQTINNEKNLINVLTEELTKEILNEIIEKLSVN